MGTLKDWWFGAPVSIFHEFHKPPYGGGNQFLLALKAEWEREGLSVGVNRVGARTKAVLFNSYNFDFARLQRVARAGLALVHRVDGPIGVYRGADDGTDQKIWQINHDLATSTVFQSQYSLNKHLELGLKFKKPVVIMNTVNPKIFHPATGGKRLGAKVKVIASSWSDNPRKGGPAYEWLDSHLDFSKYEFTFVGRTKARFQNAKHIEAVPSSELAELLRAHDVYLTATEHDPCSNALLEALACGLPAAYLNSGGHPELVGRAGVVFEAKEGIPDALDRIVKNYGEFQSAAKVPVLEEVAKRYLEVMSIGNV